ncbi:MAG TPA: xanthine dehydrogenase family protein subunit M [Chloroflexota bacterium]|nr:xanthine dehydrogenase family protein subunit M [Chloroflexota bacterium]
MELLQPTSLEEAVAALAQWGDDARIIAGGTAVVLMLKNRLIAPGALLGLDRVPGLRYIRHEPGVGLRIGAMTTLREAELAPLVRQHNPTLARTFAQVANVRVRHAATVGGNLCEADYASDPPCVLVAMGGRVKAVGPRGEREIPLGEFFTGFYETALVPDELLTELIVPDPAPTTRSAYIKHVTRSAEDRPCVGVAAVVDIGPGGVCRDLRVVAGAVADRPVTVPAAEALARGQPLTDALIAEVATTFAAALDPLSDVRGSGWYRKQVAEVLIRRAIRQALAANGEKG